MCVFSPPSTPTLHTLKHFVGIGRDKGGVRGGGGYELEPLHLRKRGSLYQWRPLLSRPLEVPSTRAGRLAGGGLELPMRHKKGRRPSASGVEPTMCAFWETGRRPSRERRGKKKKFTTCNRREVANRRDSLRQRPDEDAQERASRPSVRYVISLPSFFRLYTNG